MRKHVLVLGGGYAGTLAALRLSADARVTLIDARPTFTQRIRNHEILAGRTPAGFAYDRLLARRGAAFVHGRVAAWDPDAGEVEVARPGGGTLRLGYDGAVLALGSRTRPAAAGIAGHALTLDDPAELARAGARLARMAPGGRVLVVGGGMTGIETAAEIAGRHPHLRVVLLAAEGPGSDLSPAGAAYLAAALARLGVEVVQAAVASIEPGAALLAGGGAVGFDLCVWAGGFEGLPLAGEAGLATDAAGRLRVGPSLAVPGHPEVVGAGDAAAVPFAGGTLRMGCVTAMPLGAHAAATLRRGLGGEPGEPFRFAFPGRNISLGRRDALTQLTRARDEPTGRIITGRAAAWVKETVCRLTIGVLRAEAALGRPLYLWQRRVPAGASPLHALETRAA